jgi:hypothetical protein
MKVPTGLVVTVAVLIIGAALFVVTDGIGKQERLRGDIYEDLEIKTAYTASGEIKLLAQADADELKWFAAAQGTNQPTQTSMVLGSAEAQMMIDEDLITGPGSTLNGFFGIDTTIGGILVNTSTPLDDMHFLSEEQFAAAQGEERVFVVRTADGMPKLFYRKAVGEETPLRYRVAEGDLPYEPQTIDGKVYQPLLIGSQEAAMMRAESLFSAPGDRLEGFFGNDVIIVGVLAQNNTALDMMHILPLEKSSVRP